MPWQLWSPVETVECSHDALSRPLTQCRPTQKHSSKDLVQDGAMADLAAVRIDANVKSNQFELLYINVCTKLAIYDFSTSMVLEKQSRPVSKIFSTLEIPSIASLCSSPVCQCVVH